MPPQFDTPQTGTHSVLGSPVIASAVVLMILGVAGALVFFVYQHRAGQPAVSVNTGVASTTVAAPDLVTSLQAATSSPDRIFLAIGYLQEAQDMATSSQRDTDIQKADSIISSILTSEPHNASALRAAGYAQEVAGQYDRAIAFYTQALLYDQEDPTLLAQRGFAYFHQGDVAGGKADLEKAAVLFKQQGDSAMSARMLQIEQNYITRSPQALEGLPGQALAVLTTPLGWIADLLTPSSARAVYYNYPWDQPLDWWSAPTTLRGGGCYLWMGDACSGGSAHGTTWSDEVGFGCSDGYFLAACGRGGCKCFYRGDSSPGSGGNSGGDGGSGGGGTGSSCNPGDSCSSSANACGNTSGTYDGSCNCNPPTDPPLTTCRTPNPNDCNMYGSGTWQCSPSQCTATIPNDNQCPAPDLQTNLIFSGPGSSTGSGPRTIIVNPNTPATVAWSFSVTGWHIRCDISGSDSSSYTGGNTGSFVTNPITASTLYTFDCYVSGSYGKANNHAYRTVRVLPNPNFREI